MTRNDMINRIDEEIENIKNNNKSGLDDFAVLEKFDSYEGGDLDEVMTDEVDSVIPYYEDFEDEYIEDYLDLYGDEPIHPSEFEEFKTKAIMAHVYQLVFSVFYAEIKQICALSWLKRKINKEEIKVIDLNEIIEKLLDTAETADSEEDFEEVLA